MSLRECIIAVDAMGGDHAPKIVIEGMHLFHQQHSHVCFAVFGDEAVLTPLLKQYPGLSSASHLYHTAESVSNVLKPAQALRSMSRSSMRLALQCVANHEAHAAVSAGNTGAYLALAKHVLKTIGDIDRPAIAARIPTNKGQSVMLDMGGMLEASSQNLVEYAIMGSIFAKHVLNTERPSVGLLNVGREETKGNDTLQQAYTMLKRLPIHFVGFIEGDDIYAGNVSVVVTDGFTGNVSLKTAEGMARFFRNSMREVFQGGWRQRIAGYFARPALQHMAQKIDPRIYNGAMWLGLNGIAVKSHGGADSFAFSRALLLAYTMIQGDIVQGIVNHVATMTHIVTPEEEDALLNVIST